jgi:hypothetical protein
MSTALVSISGHNPDWTPIESEITIGKDILELLSSSMYVDPMTVYREYIQNAADSIDASHALRGHANSWEVNINIDTSSRTVTITDNGAGIPEHEFGARLAAFGGSQKRGKSARGFRGVGRLAGIGYCQELIFRSRAAGEDRISELRWDCKKLKTILRSPDIKDDLRAAVAQVVTERRLRSTSGPAGSFFQVELKGIVRHRNDHLLSPTAVSQYLSQVGPVPFDERFDERDQILAHLGDVQLGNLSIRVNGEPPLTRPYRSELCLTEVETDTLSGLELITVPSVDGEVSALGWVAHHSYLGALPASLGVRGLRVRVGNIQIGDDRLFEELFPETRFNSWSIGEVHILDTRVTPNGRRDHFEQNVHYNNLLTHLVPTAREISRLCRTNSAHRRWLRDFDLRAGKVREQLAILKQSAVGRKEKTGIETQIDADMGRLKQIAEGGLLPIDTSLVLRGRLEELTKEVARKLKASPKVSPLDALPAAKRRAYEQMIGLIYECSANQTNAKALVDKIIERIK